MSDPLLPILLLSFSFASLLTGLLLLAFELWMLILAFKKSFLWFVGVLLFPLLGAVLYYFTYQPKIPKKYAKIIKTLLIIVAFLWVTAGLIIISPSLTN